jgi:WD40 repeat protein
MEHPKEYEVIMRQVFRSREQSWIPRIVALIVLPFQVASFCNAQGKEPEVLIPGRKEGGLTQAVPSPDGSVIATSWGDGAPYTLSLVSLRGKEEVTLLESQESIFSVAFSPDGRYLATTTGKVVTPKPEKKTLRVWDLGSPKTPEIAVISDLACAAAAFVGNRDTVITVGDKGSYETEMVHWDLKTRKAVRRIDLAGFIVTALEFSPDRGLMAVALNARQKGDRVALLKTATWEEIGSLEAPNVWALSFSPDGAVLASGGSGGIIKLWDVKKAKLITSKEGHETDVLSLAFSPDGRHLLSAAMRDLEATEDASGTLKLWDSQKLEPKWKYRSEGSRVREVMFSPDGKHLLAYQCGASLSTAEEYVLLRWKWDDFLKSIDDNKK